MGFCALKFPLDRAGVRCPIAMRLSGWTRKRPIGELAGAQKADLIVAGAYGHNRVRERMLGGVTRDLLMSADRCSLVLH